MPPEITHWPYLPVFARLLLALAIGLFIGIERERRGKDAGLRTFALVALLGALGGLLGESYALLILVLIGLLIVFLNLQTLRTNQGTQLTTSTAMLVTGFVGVLCGLGHTLTPVAVGVITAALLAWKEPLEVFTIKLSENEFRSAILLGILAFVIYPALPEGSIDPWGALEPRAAWITVILIAGIGFVNYILWKIYGDRGIELTGFLGGLVNSSVAARELAQRAKEASGDMTDVAYRGVMLATAAMVIRNAVLLGILAPQAIGSAAFSFIPMLAMSISLAFLPRKTPRELEAETNTPLLNLKSPFSLSSAIKFGFLLVVIQIAGVAAQYAFGYLGVYITSLLGGLFSSSSAVAAAASLASKGTIPAEVASVCSVLASLMSVLINLPLIASTGNRPLIKRLAWAAGAVAVAGGLGMLVGVLVVR